MGGCLLVCLYPINVKTVKPIWSKFCVVPYMTSGKFHRCSEIQKFVFVKFLKSTKNCKSATFSFLVYRMENSERLSNY